MNPRQFSSALGGIGDRYIMEAAAYRRENKNNWRKWGAMAACLGLIITAAMVSLPSALKGPGGVAPSPGPETPPPIVSNDPDNSAPIVSEQPAPSSAEPLQPPAEREITILWDKVVVNESANSTIDAALRYYDPEIYDTGSWGEEDILAYYGWNLAPGYIPEGLTGGGNGPGGFVYREKATGEIVEDHGGRGFWTDFWEDGGPKSSDDLYIPTGFSIRASRSGILHCCLLPVDDARTTDFGGVPVTLSHCSMSHGPYDPTRKAPDGLSNMPAGYYDIYVASFTLNGVEYEIEAQRLELEELVKITASVINFPYSEDFTVGAVIEDEPGQNYDDPNDPASGQDYSVGEPEIEGCYDDPNNPVAEQDYSVGEPNNE